MATKHLTRLPITKLWKNEEMSFAVGILLNSTMFQDKCTFMFVFDFIFYFAII